MMATGSVPENILAPENIFPPQTNPLLNFARQSCIITKVPRRCDGMVDVTDSKSVGGDTVWVRVPPPAPRRSKLYIACSDFFQKSERAHAAAPPFQIEPATLGFDLVLGTNLETAASILLGYSTSEQSSLCSDVFYCKVPLLRLSPKADMSPG